LLLIFKAGFMSKNFTWWKDGDFFVGHLDSFPDYDTQGASLDELKSNLISLYNDIASDEIPFIRHADVLEMA